MYKELKLSLRDEVYGQLTHEQRDFIDNHMKRGKKTEWLNTMAQIKGITINEDDDEALIREKIGGWVLVDYEDRGQRDAKCECKASIRHVYHVMNMDTQDKLILGRICIENYTGLDSATVAKIKRGMEKIDLELDEILRKIVDGWRLPFDVPEKVEIPNDMQQHLALGLPLLDRQVSRLRVMIDNYHREQRAVIDKNLYEEGSGHLERGQKQPIQQGNLFDFSFDDREKTKASFRDVSLPITTSPVNTGDIPEAWAVFVDSQLQKLSKQGIRFITARELTETVVEFFGLGHDRYITGKPRAYVPVAKYMDRLALSERLELTESNQENRSYRIIFFEK